MKRKPQLKLTAAATAMLALGLAGCGPKVAHVEQMKPLVYQYQPKAAQDAGLDGVVIGQIAVPAGKDADAQDLARARAFTRDLAAILTRHKARMAGPYDDYDEIPFGEKERMALLIEPKLVFEVKPQTTQVKSEMGGTVEQGRYVGQASVRLIFREPLTKEVVFVKKAKAQDASAPYEHAVANNYNDPIIGALATASFHARDSRGARYNETVSALYTKLMAQVDAAIDPREVRMHLNEIKRLKEIKRY